MIESEAQVVRIEGDRAWVRIKPHKPCGQCDPEKGCKTVALTRMFGGQPDFCVRNPLAAKPGDYVKVAIADGMLLKTALWAYGLPVLLLIGGAGLAPLGAPQGWQNGFSLAGAVAGLVAGLLLLKRQNGLAARAEPTIVACVENFSSSCQRSTH